MERRYAFIVSIFLVFILVTSGTLFGQRVIDLYKVGGDMQVRGDDPHDKSGYAIASGDINGDGYDDIIISAPYADPIGGTDAGKIYVIFGSFNPPKIEDLNIQSADITIYGDDENDWSGYGVASGDINGDGYDDLIIGVHRADPVGRSGAGKTHVFFGESFPSPPYTIDLNSQISDITVYGANTSDYSGYSVASGDINNDGYDELIIGAPCANPDGRKMAGKTYVIFGDSFLSPPYTIDLNSQQANITVCGDDNDDISGSSVATGDINGDGYDDLIIDASSADPLGGTNAGETYIIFGESFASPTTIDLSTQSADITIYGDNPYDYYGYSVASGDVNGDGYDDIIVSAARSDPPGGEDAGKTYVILGSSFPSPPYTVNLDSQSADITIYGKDEAERSGYAVASGDVNGDGYDDIIIGAPYAKPVGRTSDGGTYVIFGSGFQKPPYIIDLSIQSADLTVYGYWWDMMDYNALSGYAVASGDINDDGFYDIIIGAPHSWIRRGETYLISGGGTIITSQGLGGKSWIKEFSLLGRDWGSFKAFGAANSQGEVHLAVGDIEADSLDEIVAGQGEGGKSWVKFFEVNGSLISTFKAFGAANTNGEVHLAFGNFDDYTSDKEIAVAQGEGGQSWVKTFKTDGTLVIVFKAFGAANAQGEVHLASGDLNEDGIDEIIVGMGEGGSSWVKVFNLWGDFIRSFRAFGVAGNPGGEVHLAVGNFDADADVEIAVATGYNGGNKVRLFDKFGTLMGEFTAFGFGGNPNGEVQIAAADIDSDGIDEVICGHGEGGSSMVKLFEADGTFIRSFKAFGTVNAQGEVHLGKSNY